MKSLIFVAYLCMLFMACGSQQDIPISGESIRHYGCLNINQNTSYQLTAQKDIPWEKIQKQEKTPLGGISGDETAGLDQSFEALCLDKRNKYFSYESGWIEEGEFFSVEYPLLSFDRKVDERWYHFRFSPMNLEKKTIPLDAYSNFFWFDDCKQASFFQGIGWYPTCRTTDKDIKIYNLGE